VWGNPVSPHPCPREGLALKQGMGKPGFPTPPPAGGFGKVKPSQEEPMFILFVCGGAAWTADVNVGKPGFPTPRPREGLALKQGYGETRFLHTLPPGGRVWAGAALEQGCGETGFPHPCGCGPEGRAPRPWPAGGFGRAQPSQAERCELRGRRPSASATPRCWTTRRCYGRGRIRIIPGVITLNARHNSAS